MYCMNFDEFDIFCVWEYLQYGISVYPLQSYTFTYQKKDGYASSHYLSNHLNLIMYFYRTYKIRKVIYQMERGAEFRTKNLVHTLNDVTRLEVYLCDTFEIFQFLYFKFLIQISQFWSLLD